jgi:predicted PolB exonuclease-like 3'-5' exonuclease
MIFFDIETEPLTAEELLQRQPKFSARANIKDPEKIEADISAKRQAYRDKAALDPYSGRVIAIGRATDDQEIICEHFNGESSAERDIVDDFWELYRENPSHMFCGFNILNFDLPFLIRRSFCLGVQVPKDVNGVFNFASTNGRRMGPRFLDLMDFWKLGNYQDRISLSNFAVHCGFKPKDGSGKDFAGLLRTDNKEAIRYLKNDVSLVRSIYNRCLGL